jgi:hypothetical protein
MINLSSSPVIEINLFSEGFPASKVLFVEERRRLVWGCSEVCRDCRELVVIEWRR